MNGDGFVALEGFLDPDEVAAMRLQVDALRHACDDTGCRRPHNTLLPLRWNEPPVRTLVSSARRQRLGEALGADDLRWISGYVSSKDARSPALWWHQDWWCWDHPISYQRSAAQVALLCYLNDADRRNGGLRILPGSHLRSAPIHAILPEAHSQSAEGVDPAHPAMSDIEGQVTFALRAGDAVVIDYRLLHGTHPNASDAARDCVLLSFTPSWRSLPEDIRAHLIDHPAQPAAQERPDGVMQEVLPRFTGTRRSLTLNRNAPGRFEAV